MKSSSTRVRKHVKNVVFRFRSVDIVIGGSERAIVLPKTLPLGLDFVERVRPIDRLFLILRFAHAAIGRGVCDGAATVAEPESGRSSSDGSSRKCWRAKDFGCRRKGKW